MQAAIANEPQAALRIFVQNQVFPQDTHFTHGVFEELRIGCDGDPVTTHELAARGAWPHTAQPFIRFSA